MAIVFMDGFDHYANTDTLLKYSTGGNFSSMVTGLLGVGQAARLNSTTTGPTKTLSSTFTTFIHGMRFRAASLPGSNSRIMEYLDASNNIVATLVFTNTGAIAWYRGNISTQVAISASSLIAANAVNYIEVKVTLSTTTSGTIEIRLNGATVIGPTSSVQTANTTASMQSFKFDNPTVQSDYDDMYFCDTTGSTNTTFLGDTKIVTVKPSGAGRLTQWTPNGAANDWSCVSDTTPDADTTYVSTTGVGNIDCYALSSAGSLTAVNAVQVNTDARKDDANTRTIAHGVGNGTTENFDAGTNVGAAYGYLVRTLDTNPLTSAAWTTGDMSTLQGAIKCIA